MMRSFKLESNNVEPHGMQVIIGNIDYTYHKYLLKYIWNVLL